MKPAFKSHSLKSRRGSVLLAAVLAIIILTIASMSVLDWAQFSIKETRRKERLNKVKTAANNELEFLFYNWANEVDKPSSQSLESRLQAMSIDGNPLVVAASAISSTAQNPAFEITDIDDTSVLPIQVGRSLETLPTTGVGIVRMSGLDKTGSVGYYSAKVTVTMNDPRFGEMTVRLGRRYTFQKASPFNFAVFYNGDLELNPAGNMIIGGDVQCNNSIFMGTNGANTLTVAGNIYFYDQFNGSTNPMDGTTYHQYKTGYNSPIFNPDPYSGSTPDQAVARAEQVKKMVEKESFIANLDPQAVYNSYSAVTPSPYASINDVQRALIAPPPTYNGALISENQVVAANRMYNKAAIRLEVKEVDSIVYAKFYDASNNDITGKFSGVVTQLRGLVHDKREGKDVAITTVDVAALKAAINADDDLKEAYNGVVYMHDTAQVTDSANLYGIRLANASDVPDFNEKGFVVASNNGVYVQGNFNNSGATLKDDARCAILADSITLLSPGWNDANSNAPMRDDTITDPALKRRATASITVNAALVSGNTPSVDGNTGNSGGVQNLIRYLEDWDGFETTINGSIGQMYNAKYFNSYFKPNGTTYQVYQNPTTRTLNFDRRLASQPPSGAPSSVIRYYRGDLFTW